MDNITKKEKLLVIFASHTESNPRSVPEGIIK